jgi:hypothetical protein
VKRLFVISAIAGVVALAGCSGGGQSAPSASVSLPPASLPTAAMHAWYAGPSGRGDGGEGDIDLMASDVAMITADSGNSSQFPPDCMSLAGDISTVQKRAPIPSATWELVWSSALNDLLDGYGDCSGGLESGNTSQVSKGVSEVKSAAPLLAALTNEFGGS